MMHRLDAGAPTPARRRRSDMMRLALGLTFAAALAVAIGAQAPAPAPIGQKPQTPVADPYAGNAAPGTTNFPLAAPAGVDSKAKDSAPPAAVNTGAFDAAKWKYGTAWDAPPKTPVWNPVKIKMQQGGKVTGGTLF